MKNPQNDKNQSFSLKAAPVYIWLCPPKSSITQNQSTVTSLFVVYHWRACERRQVLRWLNKIVFASLHFLKMFPHSCHWSSTNKLYVLINSTLNYCSSLYISALKKMIEKLQGNQNIVVLMIFGLCQQARVTLYTGCQKREFHSKHGAVNQSGSTHLHNTFWKYIHSYPISSLRWLFQPVIEMEKKKKCRPSVPEYLLVSEKCRYSPIKSITFLLRSTGAVALKIKKCWYSVLDSTGPFKALISAWYFLVFGKLAVADMPFFY